MRVEPPKIVDYTDPAYGARIRQLRKDDGHEHNLYYYRDPWNADGTRMLAVQSDLDQKHWHECLYDGDGRRRRTQLQVQQHEPAIHGWSDGQPESRDAFRYIC